MKYVKIFTLAFLMLTPTWLSAQLVNTESSRKEKKEGIQGLATLGFLFNKTTNEVFHIQNDIGIQYSKKQHTFLLLNNLELMKVSSSTGKQDLINQHFQHFRYNYSRHDSSFVTWEYFAQHQQNKLKYQDLRLITGAGPRFRIAENKRVVLFLCPLFMYEHEVESETQSDNVSTSVVKGDFYASFTLKLLDELDFKNVTYYQPALFDLNSSSNFEAVKDFRIASETALTFKLFKKKLEFSTIFSLSYDSRPPGLFVIESGETSMKFYAVKNEVKLKF